MGKQKIKSWLAVMLIVIVCMTAIFGNFYTQEASAALAYNSNLLKGYQMFNWDDAYKWNVECGVICIRGAWKGAPGSIWGGKYGDLTIFQDVDVSDISLNIDLGEVKAYYSCYQAGAATGRDAANIKLDFYDANGAVIGSNEMGWLNASSKRWDFRERTADIPKGTRKIRYVIIADLKSGQENDSYFNTAQLIIQDTSKPILNVVTEGTATGTYKAGTKVRYEAIFSEPVVVRNSGTMAMNVGGNAEYVGLSPDKTTLYYDYVLPDESHTGSVGNNIAVKISSLTGLDIIDEAGNAPNLNSMNIRTNSIYMDNLPPSITDFSIESGDATYSLGQKLKFNLTFSENITVSESPNIQLNTGTASYLKPQTTIDTNMASFEYTVKSGDDSPQLLITDIDLTGIIDIVGQAVKYNKNDYIPRLNDRQIKIDTVPPTAILSKEEDTAWSKNKTVTVTGSDTVSNVKYMYYKWSENANDSSDFPTAQIIGADNIVELKEKTGSYYLYIKAVDDAGNIGYKKSNGLFNTDNKLPDIGYNIENYNNNGTIIFKDITITSSDGNSGLKSTKYKWTQNIDGQDAEKLSGDVTSGKIQMPEDGTYKLSIIAEDNVGNIQTKEINNVIIDKIGPSVEFIPTGNPDYQKSHSVSLNVTDGKSGVKEVYGFWSKNMTADDAQWQLVSNYNFTTPPNVEAVYYLHIKAVDNIGNEKISTSNAFNVDNVGPKVFISPDGNDGNIGRESYEIDVTVSDLTSQAADIVKSYTLSESETLPSVALTPIGSDNTIIISGIDKVKYVYISASDKAGNTTIFKSKPFVADTQAPTGSIERTSKLYSNIAGVNMKFAVKDDYAKIFKMQIGIDGVYNDWEDFTETKTLILPTVEKEHSIAVKYKDENGNISTEYKTNCYYDVTPPTINIGYDVTKPTAGSVTATVSATDNFTATEKIKFNTKTNIFANNGKFTFEAKDEAGNMGSKEAVVDNIDKTGPIVAVETNNLNGKKFREVAATINAQDKNGIGQVKYQWIKKGEIETDKWLSTTNNGEVRLNGTDGEYKLKAVVSDSLGNESSIEKSYFYLDNTAPQGSIVYTPSSRTAADVYADITINEESCTITNNGGNNRYLFTENGEFAFEFADEAGNTNTKTAKVTWIDRTVPKARVIMSEEGWTTKDVNVEVVPPPSSVAEKYKFNGVDINQSPDVIVSTTDKLIITNYGILSFETRDVETGIVGNGSATIKIDRQNPTVDKVTGVPTAWTNQNATVRIEASDDLSEVNYVNGNSHVFETNGNHTFTVRDSAGNSTEKTVEVIYIDKMTPVPEIEYFTKDGLKYNPSNWTNQDITVSLTFPDEPGKVTITNNEGKNTYTFTNNESFTFQYIDEAGNTGETEINIDKIDRVPPTGYITYSYTGWINKDVVIILTANDDKSNVTITNNEGKNAYTFTENGEFEFVFRDEAGNIVKQTAKADKIDKVKPVLKYELMPSEKTGYNVYATVSADEYVTILNNGGSFSRVFKNNSNFIFSAKDRAGNENSLDVKVDNINRETTAVEIEYTTTEPTSKDVIATIKPKNQNEVIYIKNNMGQKSYVFKENGEFTFEYVNQAGIVGEATASVTNIDKIAAVINYSYSTKDITNQDVVVTLESNKPVVYSYGVVDDTVTFARNGTIYIDAYDALSNKTTVMLKVSNIDKTKPVISVGEENSIIKIGETYDVNNGITATDNTDGDLTKEIKITSNIDFTKVGDYTISYEVADKAGNVSKVEKYLTIYDPNAFNVIINSKMPRNGEIVLNTTQINMEVVNQKGDVRAKYLEGKQAKGQFKTEGVEVSKEFKLPDRGYYTLYIQDDERNSILLYLFIK